ncbi:serine/threonine protein kinase [Nocardia uniformis]|uniref:Serine/threonine protein kinase n=1 Tax=Nocardia uniformis TaxID=53432 RepID=A0A849C7L5_9NOCA|nr:serine/threonine protein kinase [Nocardia uniformis]NNH70879.1 serine/threonine protein kinase [Nocardia uniformis]
MTNDIDTTNVTAAESKDEEPREKKTAANTSTQNEKALSDSAPTPASETTRAGSEAGVGNRLRALSAGRPVAVVAILALVAVTITFAVLWRDASGRADGLEQQHADEATAERIAGQYAVGAASFDHRNLKPWVAALKSGTDTALTSRFDSAVETLTPLIREVQWVQTSKLIAATTLKHEGDTYVVQVFVSTSMTSTQNQEPVNTVTPYTLTVSGPPNWTITDVAGIAGTPQDGSTGTGQPDLTPPGEAPNPPTESGQAPR